MPSRRNSAREANIRACRQIPDRNVAWLTPRQKTIARTNKCIICKQMHKYAIIKQKDGLERPSNFGSVPRSVEKAMSRAAFRNRGRLIGKKRLRRCTSNASEQYTSTTPAACIQQYHASMSSECGLFSRPLQRNQQCMRPIGSVDTPPSGALTRLQRALSNQGCSWQTMYIMKFEHYIKRKKAVDGPKIHGSTLSNIVIIANSVGFLPTKNHSSKNHVGKI